MNKAAQEKLLIAICEQLGPCYDRIAILVNSFIDVEGPLSETTANKIRGMLGRKDT